MKMISLLSFVINCIAWLTSLFRICTSQGEAFDYIVIFFSFSILVYDIHKIVKMCTDKVRDKNSKGGQGNDSLS